MEAKAHQKVISKKHKEIQFLRMSLRKSSQNWWQKRSVASSNTFIENENEALSLQSSLWPPPGPQDGLGRGGLRLKWAKGRFGSKNEEKIIILRMALPTAKSLSGLQESLFSLFRGLQLNSHEKHMTLNSQIPPMTPISPRWANGCLGSLGLLLWVD